MFLASLYLNSVVKLPYLLLQVLLRKCGVIDATEFKRRGLSTALKGDRRTDVEARASEFVRRKVVTRIRPGAANVLEWARFTGRSIVLASGSPDALVSPLAARCKAAAFLATELAYDQRGLFLGQFRGRDCVGEEKANRIKEYASAVEVSLAHCSFFGDSHLDLEAMCLVGTAVAIWPDAILREAAAERGWRIEFW